jgi:hypothetical protein
MLFFRERHKSSLQKSWGVDKGGSMATCKSTTVRVLALLGLLTAASQAIPSKSHIVSVRVRTADEVINAVLAATRSGRPTVIRVAPGTYPFAQNFSTPFGDSKLPPISTPIAIVGKDSGTTVFEAASGAGRIVTVTEGGALLMHGLTLRGGFSRCDEDCGENGGGAAANIGGFLMFEDCVLTNNLASQVEGGTALGGAILSVNGDLWLDDTSVVDNRVRGNGAGIAIGGGNATLRRTIVSGNGTTIGAGGAGGTSAGGILIFSGARVAIHSSTISGNAAMLEVEDIDWGGNGGGIYNQDSTVWIRNSAVTENITQFFGAGGGIYTAGTMTIESSTIAGNSSGSIGGGIFNGGTLTLRGVTIARNELSGGFDFGSMPPGCSTEDFELCRPRGGGIWNDPATAGEVRLTRTLLANNAVTDCDGTLISDGYNALGNTERCTLQTSPTSPGRDQVNVDARLGELEDDGEAGHAHVPLLANSPLIDAGGRIGLRCTARDQIGQRRVDGNGDGILRCDIGAIEFQPPSQKKH